MNNEDRMRRISKAKTKLLLDHPFVGTIALNMEFRLNDNLCPPTAATNGREVIFHPTFVDMLKDDELLFVTAHEVFHPMFDHCTRRAHRDPLLWNIAADYVINRMIIEDKIGSAPQIGIMDNKDLYAKANGVTDKIYDMLLEEAKKNGGKGKGKGGGTPMPGEGFANGSSLDNCVDAEKGTEAELEAEWKQRIAQAAAAAKMCGKLSANQQRFVGELLYPKVDWRDVLQRFMQRCRTDVRSWQRPNRRFINQGIFRPSISGEAMGEIMVAIDCSGSIGNEELAQFGGEIIAIQQDTAPLKVHVLYFDSRVCHYDEFDRDNEVKVAPHGGGGTAFSPIFRYAEDKGINPVCCVVLTDLCCSDFGPPPNYPVLWVTTMKGTAPWGEIVEM